MQRTAIEWADYSANPLKFELEGGGRPINLCVPVSEGCRNCYASGIVRRFSGVTYSAQAMKGASCVLEEAEVRRMLAARVRGPFKWGRARPLVFVGDMTDLGGEFVPDEAFAAVLAVAALREDMDFAVLTKRAGTLREKLGRRIGHRIYEQVTDWLDDGEAGVLGRRWEWFHELAGRSTTGGGNIQFTAWKPLRNVWFGVSVEDERTAAGRMQGLWEIGSLGFRTFVSYEPALGPVDWDRWLSYRPEQVICGGESGRGARAMHPDWARAARDACVARGVKFFFKQWGEWCPGLDFADDDGLYAELQNGDLAVGGDSWMRFDPDDSQVNDWVAVRVGKKASGRLLDGREWNEVPGVANG